MATRVSGKALKGYKNLEYRLAIPKDRQKLLEFLLCHFGKDEPCNRALQMPRSSMEIIFSGTIDRCLQSPFSTIVTDSSRNGEVAACLLNSVWSRSDLTNDADFSTGDVFPENVQLFVNFLNSMHSNFWELAPRNVECVIHREIVSVATPYMRKGIASRLLTESMSKKQLQRFKIGGVLSEATSLANQCLEKSYGFKCLLEKPYSEVIDSKGHCVLKLDDGTTHLRLNYKPIGEFIDLHE